jgi:hypothetical protein
VFIFPENSTTLDPLGFIVHYDDFVVFLNAEILLILNVGTFAARKRQTNRGKSLIFLLMIIINYH